MVVYHENYRAHMCIPEVTATCNKRTSLHSTDSRTSHSQEACTAMTCLCTPHMTTHSPSHFDIVPLSPRSGPLPRLMQPAQPLVQAQCCCPMSYGAWAGATRCLCTDCCHTSTYNTVQQSYVAARHGTPERGTAAAADLVGPVSLGHEVKPVHAI